MTSETTRRFGTIGEFRAKSRAEMDLLCEALATLELPCRCSSSDGVVAVAPRGSPITSSKGLKLFFGADVGQLLLWSGLQYLFPMSLISAEWVDTLLDQPETSYTGGVLKSLNERRIATMDIRPCIDFSVYGDVITRLLADGTTTAECLSLIRSEVVRNGGIVKSAAAHSLDMKVNTSQYFLDVGIGAWQHAWVFGLTTPQDDQDVPRFLQQLASDNGAIVSSCV